MFPDDLDEYTYSLMEGIVGEKNMTFERDASIKGKDCEGEETRQLTKESKEQKIIDKYKTTKKMIGAKKHKKHSHNL